MKLIQKIAGCLLQQKKIFRLLFRDGKTARWEIFLHRMLLKKELKASTMKSGIEYMVELSEWYRKNSSGKGVGFFQIGGGIAGDFPICVVPMMYQDLGMA